MNGKEINGRQIKVDYDVKESGKASYKINISDERNRLYNREPIKMEKSKHIKKDRDRQKMEKIKSFHKHWSMQSGFWVWSVCLIK